MSHFSSSTTAESNEKHFARGLDAASVRQAIWMRRLSDYAELTKPRIATMVAVTTFIGFAFGLPLGFSVGGWSWTALLSALGGTTLACMGSAILNQVYERDTDRLMVRTANRPLAAERVGAWEALILGIVLASAGSLWLLVGTNALAAGLCIFTILSYTHVYTPLKRQTWLATHLGAVPGAMPPVIGFAAARGTLDYEALVLFLIMFIWQLPHFLAIAYLYRDDYARAGIPMLPVIEPDGRRTFRQILIGCVLLVIAGILPTYYLMSGYISLVVATGLGLAFLWMAIQLVRTRRREQARKLFFASLIYLPAVFAAMLLNRVW